MNIIIDNTTRGRLKDAIEEYTEGKVKTIVVFRDPEVSTCYAVKTSGKDCDLTWLVTGLQDDDTTETIAWERLEEAEFESWPPRSGSLKFF